MDRYFLIVLDHFELRKIHANSLPAETWLSKDNNTLAGGDHFLLVMQVEPSTHQRLAQSICLRLLERGLKNFFPSAKTTQRRFNYLTAKTDRNIAFLAWKTRELGAIFVAAGEMSEQVFHRLYP